MSEIVDMISPEYIGEERIRITLRTQGTILAGSTVTVDFNYGDVGNRGLQFPIDFVVQPSGKSRAGYFKKTFTKRIPLSYTFNVSEAGRYLITLRERYHNQFWGRLVINVEGDKYSTVSSGGMRR